MASARIKIVAAAEFPNAESPERVDFGAVDEPNFAVPRRTNSPNIGAREDSDSHSPSATEVSGFANFQAHAQVHSAKKVTDQTRSLSKQRYQSPHDTVTIPFVSA